MNISDIFGNFRHRPNHPHFWRLSNIILKLDGRMDAAATDDQKDAVWTDNLTTYVDEPSANYMAFQRASRMFGVVTVADVRKHADDILRPMVAWLEGFQVGAEFATHSLEDSNSLRDLDETGLRLLLGHYEKHVMKSLDDSVTPMSVAEFYETFER